MIKASSRGEKELNLIKKRPRQEIITHMDTVSVLKYAGHLYTRTILRPK